MEASYQAAGGDGRWSDVLPTSGKQPSLAHHLAETMHFKDNSYNSDSALEKSNRPSDDHMLLVLEADADQADDAKNKDLSGQRRRGGDSSVSGDIQILAGGHETKNEP